MTTRTEATSANDELMDNIAEAAREQTTSRPPPQSTSEGSTATTTNDDNDNKTTNTSNNQPPNRRSELATLDIGHFQRQDSQTTCTDPNCSFWRRVALLSARATNCDSSPGSCSLVQQPAWPSTGLECSQQQQQTGAAACCANLTPPPPPLSLWLTQTTSCQPASASPPTSLALAGARSQSPLLEPSRATTATTKATTPTRLSFARRNSSAIALASPLGSLELCRSPSGSTTGRPLIFAPFRAAAAAAAGSRPINLQQQQSHHDPVASGVQVGRSPSFASLAGAGRFASRRTSGGGGGTAAAAACYDSSSAASSRKSSITFAKQQTTSALAANELSGKRDLSTSCLTGVGWQPPPQPAPAATVVARDEGGRGQSGSPRRKQLKRRRPLKCIRSSSDNQLSQSRDEQNQADKSGRPHTDRHSRRDSAQPFCDRSTANPAAAAAASGEVKCKGGVAISVTDASGCSLTRRRRSSTESIPSSSSPSSVNNSGAESDKENSTDDEIADDQSAAVPSGSGDVSAPPNRDVGSSKPQTQQQQFDGRPTRFYSVNERPQHLYVRPSFLLQQQQFNQQQQVSQAGSPTGSGHSCSSRQRLGSHSPSRFNFGG